MDHLHTLEIQNLRKDAAIQDLEVENNNKDAAIQDLKVKPGQYHRQTAGGDPKPQVSNVTDDVRRDATEARGVRRGEV